MYNLCAARYQPAQTAEGIEPGSGEQTLVPSLGANIHTWNKPEEYKRISTKGSGPHILNQNETTIKQYLKQHLPREPFSVFHPRIVSGLPAAQASVAAETLYVIITTFRANKELSV